ncbi:copper oxidase, partial [Geminicoccus flavidas]|uniref:copper oxidase n=1 Tax=Geminicoccus flavidas TaxID=2506407 RepID=UPI001F172048
ALGTGAALASLSDAQARALGEPRRFTDPATREPLPRKQLGGRTSFVTLNGGSLPWRLNDGVKEFHLVAEPVQRELAPGSIAHLWGYNGSSPGPTIEAIEGDRVRIFVTNRLPEHTTIHWHGILLPSGMDGVGGLTQPQIQPGETYVYEFSLKKSGTFMYHPHADEMVQMAMGMMGLLIVHPKDPSFRQVDRDFGFLMANYEVKPGTWVPDTSVMLEFNTWAWNSRVFPGIDPLVVRKGDRVRIRIGNLTMTNHPIHLHGYDFKVTGTDGGWIPEGAQWPEVSVDVPVGAMRTIEFVADEEGDWAFHCHKSHHTMGPMGHGIANMIGVRQGVATKRIGKLLPDYMYMPMGEQGMAEMQDMAAHGMSPPENTLPMMAGEGPFGPIEMGGMFTVLKVRADIASDDYADPGWFEHPEGTVAWRVDDSGRAT